MFDKQSKQLKPEVLEKARRLVGVDQREHFAEEMKDVVLEMKKLREEYRAKLLDAAKAMRDVFEAGDKAMDKVKRKGIDLISATEQRHKEAVDVIREAHPDLREAEFSFDLEEGTYTPYGPLGSEPPNKDEESNHIKRTLRGLITAVSVAAEEAKRPKRAEPEADEETKQMVNDLMKRIAKKE